MIEEIIANIKQIKEYAKDNKVPIMQDASMDFITTTITKRNVKNIPNPPSLGIGFVCTFLLSGISIAPTCTAILLI